MISANDDAIATEDYRFTAQLLRAYMSLPDTSLFRAVCSNNLSIILAALDQAGGDEPPEAA